MAKLKSQSRGTAKQAASTDEWDSESYVTGQTLPTRRDPEVYAQWLFDFLRMNLADLDVVQRTAVCANVWAFVRPEVIEDKSWGDEYLPPLATVKALQKIALDGVQRVRDGEWFALQRGIGYGIKRMGRRIIRGLRRGTFEDHFRSAVMDSVQQYWERLRECPKCHGTFVKVGKQKYCSKRCASEAHWEKFKKNRSKRDHHVEYVARVRKQTGAKLTVRRKGAK